MSPERLTRAIPCSSFRFTRNINSSLAAYFLLLSFWFLTALHLDRYPINQVDEGWILSPGYQLVTQGSFGTSLFAGYYGAEQHLFDFMPLFAIVQGMAAFVFGITSFTVRYTNLALGMILLALLYVLARQWFNTCIAIVTVALNLLWVWGNRFGQNNQLFIPVMSNVRFARYDVLAVVLSLAACSTFTRAIRTADLRFFGLSGFVLGLACLTHLYSFFWLPVIGGVLLIRRTWTGPRFFWRQCALLALGFILPWLIWLGYIFLNWNDYVSQAQVNAHSFDVLNPQFYLNNLRNEIWRYVGSGSREDPRTYPGILVALFILPIAWLSLARRTLRERDAARLIPVGGALLLPLSFAVFMDRKYQSYLIAIVPLQTILFAWYLDDLSHSPRFALRLAAPLLLVVALGTGVLELSRMHYAAAFRQPNDLYLQQLAAVTPEGGRILGPIAYWIAFPDRDYRSFTLIEYLTQPLTFDRPLSPLEAFAAAAPDIVLLDAHDKQLFESQDTPDLQARGSGFWQYMNTHKAQRVATVPDPDGEPLEIYALAR